MTNLEGGGRGAGGEGRGSQRNSESPEAPFLVSNGLRIFVVQIIIEVEGSHFTLKPGPNLNSKNSLYIERVKSKIMYPHQASTLTMCIHYNILISSRTKTTALFMFLL